MQTAGDLQNLVDQAYSNYTSDSTQVALVNKTVTTLLAAASVAAQNGQYSFSYPLGNLATNTAVSNPTLFQRYMGEILGNLNFDVQFSYTSNENWVVLKWTPDL